MSYTDEELEKFSDEELAALSDEERAALTGGDENETPSDDAEGEDSQDADGGETSVEDDNTEESAKGEDDSDGKDAEDGKLSSEFVYEPSPKETVDYGKLIEELSEKFENGQISAKEFASEMNKISVAQAKAEMAAEMTREIRAQRWEWAQKEFFKAMPEFGLKEDGTPKDPVLFAALDAQLKVLYSDPAKRGYSELEYLREAGRLVRERFGLANKQQESVTASKLTKRESALQKANIPKTLANIPAAMENDKDEFAELDKLEGIELELALAQLSPAKQKQYLMGR
jgi:hypothetical protein